MGVRHRVCKHLACCFYLLSYLVSSILLTFHGSTHHTSLHTNLPSYPPCRCSNQQITCKEMRRPAWSRQYGGEILFFAISCLLMHQVNRQNVQTFHALCHQIPLTLTSNTKYHLDAQIYSHLLNRKLLDEVEEVSNAATHKIL
jgi:hypothetical protein